MKRGTREATPERKHATESEARLALLASIVDSSDDAIMSKTPDGVITTWNRAAEQIYGYKAEEIIGKPVSVLIHPDRPDEMVTILENIRNGKRVVHYETLRVRKDGKAISVSLSVSPIHDATGNVVGVSSIARDITERKRAEAQARTASQYARSLIEASLDPLVTISPEGQITDVNEATIRVTGVSREKLIGTDFSDYFTEPEKAGEGYRRAFSEGSVTDYPLTIRHADGRLAEVLYNATVYRDAQGKTLGVFAAARDVTEQKQASQYARSLIEASLDPLVTISPEGKITDVNAATEEVTGVPRERLIGSDFLEYFTEPEKARAGYERVFSESFVRDYPLAIRHASGKVADVLYNAALYRDGAGKVQGVFAAARDVTELKRAGQARDRFFNLSLDMLCIAGFDGYFKQLNPAWTKTLGWRNDELLAKPYLEFVHPEDRPSTIDAAQGLAEGKTLITFDNRYLCKDGSYTWLSWSCYPLLEDQTIFAIARDVSAQRAHQESLRRAKERAEAANTELEAFSYSVSHDLRAPLRSIDGFTQALLEDCADTLDQEGKTYLGRVRQSAQQMAQLIDDLLGLSRVSRAELHRSEIDLADAARSVLARLQREQPDRTVELVIPREVPARGDTRLLSIVLENLLGNAWKFTRTHPRARVEFGHRPEAGRSVYFVRDNGAGFDMAYAHKLFGVFQRLHSASEFEGTGIGLATVQRIVHRHGGRVWAEGEVDRGATFYFTLEEGA